MPQSDLDGNQPAAEPAPIAAAVKKPLPPVAQRALAEAAARRVERERATVERSKESNGPSGPDPVRYGDWERKGIASDF
jgi:hypothetical protein